MTTEIKEKYPEIIGDIYYIDVMNKENNLLGYAIKYIFINYNYEDKLQCESIGYELKELLKDKIINYECSETGQLTIINNIDE